MHFPSDLMVNLASGTRLLPKSSTFHASQVRKLPDTAHGSLQKWLCNASLADDNATIGGLIRDSKGTIMAAFSLPIQTDQFQELELEAIHHAIILVTDLNVQHLWIESDSLLAVNIIKGIIACPWKKKPLLADIVKILMNFSWFISHIWREANRAADFLSKTDCPGKGSAIFGNHFPITLIDIVKEDLEGNLYSRMYNFSLFSVLFSGQGLA
ncbi:uncharacterized protein LOC143882436 [Tasmannia lanceolata]|uniref:uncharacterized protein LOC143882436 n=1 Tax=Tasmannia lanceolata TaxID=3420 RepID=UPI004063F993